MRASDKIRCVLLRMGAAGQIKKVEVKAVREQTLARVIPLADIRQSCGQLNYEEPSGSDNRFQ